MLTMHTHIYNIYHRCIKGGGLAGHRSPNKLSLPPKKIKKIKRK